RLPTDHLDLAERRPVEKPNALPGTPCLILNGLPRVLRPVACGPQPAAIFLEDCSSRAMNGLQRQPAHGRQKAATPCSGEAGEGHGRERRPVSGGADFGDRAAGNSREQGKAIEVRRLALVRSHAKRRVALQVLDRDEVLPRSQFNVLGCYVALIIYPYAPLGTGFRPQGDDAEGGFHPRAAWDG